MALKTTKVTYEISLEEIKKMLAKELHVALDDIEVQYEIGTEYHGGYDSYEIHKVKGIKVVSIQRE